MLRCRDQLMEDAMVIRKFSAALVFAVVLAAMTADAEQPVAEPLLIDFWSGNRTEARQNYERDLLKSVLDATTQTYGPWQLTENKSDYPKAQDEAGVFRAKGHHLFVTVAGNKKLANEDKIVVPIPIMKGLLGYRILIIREEDRETFAQITSAHQLKQLRLGIPETWADADLFRHNGFKVVERGSFDDLFDRLAAGEFDYVAFGANEIDDVYTNRAKAVDGLRIEDSLLVFYPFPLVFYVHPEKVELARRVQAGLQAISDNGTLDEIFARYYGSVIQSLHLEQRQQISLENPMLPSYLSHFEFSVIKM